MQKDKADGELAFALLIIRWPAAAILLIWALDKFLRSVAALKTFSKFYLPLDSATLIGLIGVLRLVLVLAFAVGAFRTWTYGAVVLMHAGSTLASWSIYLEPWDPGPTFFFGLPFQSWARWSPCSFYGTETRYFPSMHDRGAVRTTRPTPVCNPHSVKA